VEALVIWTAVTEWERYAFAAAAAIYGAAAAHGALIWRGGFRRETKLNAALIMVGLLAHTAGLWELGFRQGRCPVGNLAEAALVFAWAAGAAYLLVSRMGRGGAAAIGPAVAPILFGLNVFALTPGVDRLGAGAEPAVGLRSLHVSLTVAAYGAFGLAAAAAAVYLLHSHDLKQRKLRAVLARLPSVQRLDRICQQALAVGLALFTVGLGLGFVWLRAARGEFFTPDVKIVWSLFVWAVYFALAILRWRLRAGNRRLAWASVGAFAFLILTFWITSLLSGIHQP